VENIFIIRKHRHNSLLVHKKALLIETMNLMAEMYLSIKPQEKICNLSKLEQCLVEMLKAYILGAKLIILDNIPITVFQDVRFSNLIEQLKSRNVFFLITSCDIYQLQLFSDRIYILSDTHIVKWIYNEKRNKIDISKLYNQPITYIETPLLASSEISVRADNVCYASLKNISFQLFKGEIVTMFDLFRNVSAQLLTLFSNPQKLESGSILVYGETYRNPVDNSFVFANFDLKNSVFETLSLRDNICMSNYKKLAYPMGVLKKSRIKFFEDSFLKEYKKDGMTTRKHCYHPSKKERLAIYLSKFELLQKKIFFCIHPEKYIDYDTFYILKNSLQRIANNGNTVCIITCDFEKVYQLASRHLILLSDSLQEYEKVSPT
jgi:ABC-type sugar transport system ATPase subunit